MVNIPSGADSVWWIVVGASVLVNVLLVVLIVIALLKYIRTPKACPKCGYQAGRDGNRSDLVGNNSANIESHRGGDQH